MSDVPWFFGCVAIGVFVNALVDPFWLALITGMICSGIWTRYSLMRP